MAASMTWEGPFVDMDPLTLQTIVQMQLEDGEELATNSKGKQREGTVSDAQLAMQMYMEDLKTCDTFLKDRAMAQSAAMAILSDGNLIAEAYRQEQQAARDHEMAMRLDARQRATASTAAGPAPKQRARQQKRQKKDHKDPWEDPEMLEKVAAIYMQAPEKAATSAPAVDYDSDGTVAESSAWAAARRKTNSKRPLRACIACTEEKDFFEVVRVPCGHEYCRACVENLFSMAMKDESLFPPRCDKQEITLDWVRLFISSKLAKDFEEKYDEMSTKNRTYCHEPTCATFIPQDTTDGDVATCPKCMKTTCSICKNPSHSGDCPEDEALNQLIDTAESSQWQRCYQCKSFVELTQGCNHMNCRCGAQFCYICAERWKTCNCEHFTEAHLYNRAATIVDRDPNRRLFQPERVPHTQPIVPPPPPSSTVANVSGRPGLLRRKPASRVPPAVVEPESEWQSDFSDHSEWEHDWWLRSQAEQEIPPMTEEEPIPPVIRAPPSAVIEDVPAATASTKTADPTREQLIAAAMEHLRNNHACTHDNWKYRRGRHQCEECRHPPGLQSVQKEPFVTDNLLNESAIASLYAILQNLLACEMAQAGGLEEM